MRLKSFGYGLSVFIAVLLFAPPAHANMGVPMIFITLPVMLVALIPIIGIEAYVLLERLGLSFWKSVEVASAANFASTVIGMPVTWFLLFLVTLLTGGGSGFGIRTAKARFLTVTLGASWLPPVDKTMTWMAPAAGFVLLIPFFFASWLVEYEVGIWILDEMNAGNVSSAVLMGNLITYGILAALVATVTLYEYFTTATENASPTVADATVAKPKEAKIARRYQVRPMYSSDFHETWRLANEHARRGITWLRVAEKIINRQRQTASADFVRRTEDTKRDKAA